ncbi:pilus assembly protein TadG-related protein [Streptomyces sp. NBC_01218]|uniref:pilus assembly protein TadG-related protein n=1 Tax=Streptomyces sp. NBC_01218 TaxID=2903780 RepID=UPI002E10681C|nr:pilus assembly protein TadG-related protein [Streptomyces sp. NBC_01218]
MVGWNQRDRGQAFPIYVMMVAGLLFLALAFFAVGKASALRNGAQGAADASALAAAQSTRERFEAPFIAALWANSIESFLNSPFAPACDAAQGLASDNDAELLDCFPQYDSDRDSITTRVKGRGTVGSSVLPSVDRTHATAEATAVINFWCDWTSVDLNDDTVQDIYFFTCDHGRKRAEIRPSSPPTWSSVSKILFDVHLVDR